jgi:hypothetical protein
MFHRPERGEEKPLGTYGLGARSWFRLSVVNLHESVVNTSDDRFQVGEVHIGSGDLF